MDSIYDLTDEMSDSLEENSNDESGKQREIRFISQIPEVEPFANRRGQDINKFFIEYEKYCRQCYPARKNLWIRGLKDSLEGPMLEAFKVMTTDIGLNIKYEVLKNRLIDQAKRMKKTSRQDKRNNFDRIKLNSGESLWAYAMRLEIAAIEKFGEDYLDLEDDKELFRKFLDTIPDDIRILITKQRDQRKRLGANRYSWNDLRQDLEDNIYGFEDFDSSRQEKTVRMAVTSNQDQVFNNYKDALMASQDGKEVDQLYMIRATWQESKKQTELLEKLVQPRGRSSGRGDGNRGSGDRSSSRNRSFSGNRSSSYSGNRTSSSNTIQNTEEQENCTYCRRTGHNWKICRTRRGECYACGEKGHLIIDCTKNSQEKKDKRESRQGPKRDQQSMKCQLCDRTGHKAKDCQMMQSNKEQQDKRRCQLCEGTSHEAKDCPLFQKLQKEAGN